MTEVNFCHPCCAALLLKLIRATVICPSPDGDQQL
jgi:hypothetical protein